MCGNTGTRYAFGTADMAATSENATLDAISNTHDLWQWVFCRDGQRKFALHKPEELVSLLGSDDWPGSDLA
jgi:hypothetical protein